MRCWCNGWRLRTRIYITCRCHCTVYLWCAGNRGLGCGSSRCRARVGAGSIVFFDLARAAACWSRDQPVLLIPTRRQGDSGRAAGRPTPGIWRALPRNWRRWRHCDVVVKHVGTWNMPPQPPPRQGGLISGGARTVGVFLPHVATL